MTRRSRSGLVALGAMALAGAVAGESVAGTPKVNARQPVRATTVARPAVRPAVAARPVAQQPKVTKIANRDRGSFNRPAANSAYYTLGLNRRFLKAGDTWTMAWSSMTRFSIRKSVMPAQGTERPFGPPVYVTYRVKKVWQAPLGTGKRTLATIQIGYARQPLLAQSTGAEITVDQFWNPVSFRVISPDLPYGKRQDKDTRRVIHGVGEFPLYVGDLENVPARRVPLPRLTPSLGQHRPLSSTVYASVVNNGKNVHGFTYWTPGYLYATAVVTQHHQGVLISQQLAR